MRGESKQSRENSRTLWRTRSRSCGTTSSSKPRARLWLWLPPNRRQIAWLPHSIFRQSPMQPRPIGIGPRPTTKYFRSLSWRALLQIAPSSTAALGRAVPLAVKTLRNVMSTASCAPWWSGSPAKKKQLDSPLIIGWHRNVHVGVAPDNPTSHDTHNEPQQRATAASVSRGPLYGRDVVAL